MPVLIGATVYAFLPQEMKEKITRPIADAIEDIWDNGFEEDDLETCEGIYKKGDPPVIYMPPNELGPLKDAYGLGKQMPTGDPGKDKDYWKKPKDWNKMSKWKKAKWYIGKGLTAFGWGSGAGV